MQVKIWVFELEITQQTDGLPKDDLASASQHSSSEISQKIYFLSQPLCYI
jgi:hypothetical protein